MGMKKFLNFDQMITPMIIKVVFWIAVALMIIGGLFYIGVGMTTYNGQEGVIVGILMIVFGPLMARVYCELIMITFKLYESLNEIKHTLKQTTNKQTETEHETPPHGQV